MNNVGEQARLAVSWNACFNLFRELLQVGMTLVLVRLIAPETYGQFGLIMTIIGFLQVFSFEHFLAHTLQVRRDGDVHYQDHFTAGAAFQIGVCVLTNIGAFILYRIEPYAVIAPILHVMSVMWLLDWPSALRIKMLERALDWKRLRLLHAFGLLGGGLLAISLASVGAGLYALCLSGFIKRLVFLSDLLLVYRWRPTWAWNANTYVPAWQFGLTRVASAMLTTGRKLSESGVFVHMVGFAGFGVYCRAVGLASMVCAKLVALVIQAIYPVLTKIEPGQEVYGRTSALALRSMAWLVIPLGSLGARLAEPMVHLLYGETWTQVIPLLPWAMAAGTAGALTYTVYMLALAGEHKRGCLLADLCLLLGTGINLLWVLPRGIHLYLLGACMLQMGVFLWLCQCLYVELKRVMMIFAEAILAPLIATIGAWLLCEGVRYYVAGQVDDISTVCWYSIGFGTLYIVLLRALATTQFDELWSQLPGARYWHRVRMRGV